MKKKSDYSEKLKDPRWQKKRLGILERDEWRCQHCGDTKNTLHVHHRIYLPGKEPWDISDDCLVTLCESCHEYESLQMAPSMQALVEEVKRKFLADDVAEISVAFASLEIPHLPEVFASAIKYWFETPELVQEILQRYFNSLGKGEMGSAPISGDLPF